MAGAIHELAVQKVLEDWPAAKTRRLMREIRAAVPNYAEEDFKFHLGAIPDAFLIDRDRKTVVLFEVEDSHPVSEQKMDIYVDLWWVLDWNEWDLVLVTLDRWGNYLTEFNLASYVAKKLVLDAKRNPQKRSPSRSMIEWVSAIKKAYVEGTLCTTD